MPRSIVFDGVTKKFGERVALDGLSFRVKGEEIYGFVGSNGAGKTTAMRIALGVLTADAGRVLLDEKPVTFETRGTVGYMPEERGLYPAMRVGEQLAYIAELHGLSRSEAKRASDSWTDRLGIGDRRKDQVQQLSLGNQQRVQLAAALVHDPAVLVLDEPFSGLDPLAVELMSEVLRERASEGTPVLFSSHQLDLVERICSRVGIVKSGRLVVSGSVSELQSHGLRRINVEISLPIRGQQACSSDWWTAIEGVNLKSQSGTRFELELNPDVDEQHVLHLALQYGSLIDFHPVRRSLADLFHGVVVDADLGSSGLDKMAIAKDRAV